MTTSRSRGVDVINAPRSMTASRSRGVDVRDAVAVHDGVEVTRR
jgi:hypothetical protein